MFDCLSGPNALSADRMTAEERLLEIGRILAVGFLRHYTRDICLDFPPDRSGVGRELHAQVGGR